jgi:hypothetical protein
MLASWNERNRRLTRRAADSGVRGGILKFLGTPAAAYANRWAADKG